MGETDLISRADIEWHEILVRDGKGMYHDEQIAYKSQIDDLPSAQKKGHWLHKKIISSNSDSGFFLLPECTCSECNIMVEHEANGTYICHLDGYEIQDNACDKCDRKVVDGK